MPVLATLFGLQLAVGYSSANAPTWETPEQNEDGAEFDAQQPDQEFGRADPLDADQVLDIDLTVRELQKHFGVERWGGFWYEEHEGHQRLVVGVVGATASDGSRAATLGTLPILRTQNTRYSWAYLIDAKAKIHGVLDPLLATGSSAKAVVGLFPSAVSREIPFVLHVAVADAQMLATVGAELDSFRFPAEMLETFATVQSDLSNATRTTFPGY